MAPMFRWEFNVVLSGWGQTQTEALESVMESLVQDGLEEMDEVRSKKDSVRMFRKGECHAMRAEIDESCYGPEGTMLVWKED